MNTKLLTISALAFVAGSMFSACKQTTDMPTDIRYSVAENGLTVTDKFTKLEWARCSYGQTFSGDTCTGKPKNVEFADAEKIASGFELDGKSDWRLPNAAELRSIRYCHEKAVVLTNHDSVRYPCHENDQIGADRKHVDNKIKNPTVYEEAFPSEPFRGLFYWSSDLLAYDELWSWGVDFRNGQSKSRPNKGGAKLRFVRN